MAKQGFTNVDVAEDGEIAVQKFMKNPLLYDLIFMDINMPNKNGLEATMEIRAYESKLDSDEFLRRVPIVALTANNTEIDRQKCFKAGMDDHMVKPLNFNILIDKISQYACRNDIRC